MTVNIFRFGKRSNRRFSPPDLKDARTREGQASYIIRRTGRKPFSEGNTPGHKWLKSRVRLFGLDFGVVRMKFAVLNIGAYHSKEFKDFPLLAALPSSRVSLEWAQQVLFPQAMKGKRVVICLRAAHFWGLEAGKQHGRSLFAPDVTREGQITKKTKKQKRMRDEIIRSVRKIVDVNR